MGTPPCSPTRRRARRRRGRPRLDLVAGVSPNGAELDDDRRRHDPAVAVRAGPHGHLRAGSSPRPTRRRRHGRGARARRRRSELFGAAQPGRADVTIGGVAAAPSSVCSTRAGSTVGGDQDDQVVIPATTFADDSRRHQPRRRSRRSTSKADDQQDLSAAYQEANARDADLARGDRRDRRLPGRQPGSRSSRRRPAPTTPSPCCSRASRRSRCSSAGSAS